MTNILPRDSVIKIAIINDLGKVDLTYVKEINTYFFKIFKRGGQVKDKVLRSEEEYFEKVLEFCNVDLKSEE